MPNPVVYPIEGTQPPDPRYDLGAGAQGAGSFFGKLLGQRILTNRLAKQLNPMREALLASQAASPVQNPTPQQQMILAAASDSSNPKRPGLAFARLAGSQEGALQLAGALQGSPRERDIVVNAGSDLNRQYGLGLEGNQSAIITRKYDANDNVLPGFTLKSFHDPADSSGGADGGGPALAEARELERRDIAEGKPAWSAERLNAFLQTRRETTKNAQEYNKAQLQWVREGNDPREFPDFESWTPSWSGQLRIAQAGADAAIKGLETAQTKAIDAQRQLETLTVGAQLLESGAMNAGAAANQRQSVGRFFDTLLGRPPTENASAYTDAYIANAGRAVGQNIKLFGAGTGLSDADREFARLISGADVTMTPEALRLILEINARGAMGEIKRYNDARDFLASSSLTIPQQFQPIAINDLQIGPLQKAPANLSPQEKIEFYLAQRPSYVSNTQTATPGSAGTNLPPPGSPQPTAAPAAAPAVGPYSDPEKEARYQEWLRSQRGR